MLPRLGHATGGASASSTSPRYGRVAAAACCDMGWISVVEDATNQRQRDWKHVLMQNVVTLNTCCDAACLTFQLPHTTTGSFQRRQCQPTTGSHSHQHLKKHNKKPSVRWKSFYISQVSVVTFQVGWASGLQFVFFWDNVNNQKYVWIILLKNDFFWISQGKVATSDRWGGQIC